MMWPVEVVAASGRPDPVGHVKWLRWLVHWAWQPSGKAGARSRRSAPPASGLRASAGVRRSGV